MYPITILRSEFVCLVILTFLFFVSRAYNVDKDNKTFIRILILAFIHVVFDAITVITVNHIDTIPNWLNWICHVIFYISAILFSIEVAIYAVKLVYPDYVKRSYRIGLGITSLYVLSLSFLKIEYVEDVGTYSSAGPAAIVGYGIAFLFFIIALVVIFTNWKKIPRTVRDSLIPMMLILITTETCQIIWRSVLFTGGAVTIVTVGFFFSLENPIEVFKKKAMTDAITGVRSRMSFEEDIQKYNKHFIEKPNNDYIFVFCDLNDLRTVNNQFGHTEGDNYIILIATAIKECMKSSTSVYRFGGDEFLVLYYKTSEDIVQSEIKALRSACEKASKDLEYVANVAAGYAVSSENYKSLDDVVKTADYAMYQNKAKIKGGEKNDESLSANLNYVGLTDTLFEAMCASNDKTYPFVTNMNTNVTRISPSWKEYFGLDSEFYNDFLGMWKDRIHPDYFEGYMDDVVATINGHKKYHHYDYLAKKANGEYVMVSCHGSIYLDNANATTYFAGYIINHGLDENIDPVTGLDNFDILSSDLGKRIDDKLPFSILKLRLNSFARVNMLYGYKVGNEVIRSISEMLKEEVSDVGKVYCQASINFTIVFGINDKEFIEKRYKQISNKLFAGINSSVGVIPIETSGGAYINNGEHTSLESLRSGLVYSVEESNYNQRNEIVFYKEEDKEDLGVNISLLSDIHADAMTDIKNFLLRYQPIIDMHSGKPVGSEALLRYKDDKHGEIAPSKFIGFLENDPCFYRLGLWIIDRAISDGKLIQEKIPNFKMNVNITALQLHNEDFPDDVMKILNKYNFNPNELILELTERCKELDSEFLSRKISELRDKGFKVAFDDLGTGYSTINLLMNIPVDEIKLDRDFVKDIGINDKYQLFVKALTLGRTGANKYDICFEGIENTEVLTQLKEFGNFLAQGYYFAKPLLIDDFIKYISKII